MLSNHAIQMVPLFKVQCSGHVLKVHLGDVGPLGKFCVAILDKECIGHPFSKVGTFQWSVWVPFMIPADALSIGIAYADPNDTITLPTLLSHLSFLKEEIHPAITAICRWIAILQLPTPASINLQPVNQFIKFPQIS